MTSTSDAAAMREEAARVADALDAYRLYIDASDRELVERGITRAQALLIARNLDPYDGNNPSGAAIRALPLPPPAPSPGTYAEGVEAVTKLAIEHAEQNRLASEAADQKRDWGLSHQHNYYWRALSEFATAIRRLAPPPVAEPGWQVVPKVPTEEMWGGLPRQILLWWGSTTPAGAALYNHLRNAGCTIPAWLLDEIPDTDHVPPKGNVAVAIYRAMLAAAPASPAPADTGGKEEREAVVAFGKAYLTPERIEQFKTGFGVIFPAHKAIQICLDSFIAAIERADHLAPAGKEEG